MWQWTKNGLIWYFSWSDYKKTIWLLEAVVWNFYAKQDKNDQAFKLSKWERFLGAVLLSGYHSLPSEHHFWSNQSDYGVPIIAETMNSKRFLKIKDMFHLVDKKLTVGIVTRNGKIFRFLWLCCWTWKSS